jgi:hypothetical protein
LILPAVSFASDVINWKDVAKYYDQNKTVEGTIVDTKCTTKVCYLNFDHNWKEYFTAVIFASDWPKFPSNPDKYYMGKKVQVSGTIKEYQGKPEVILKNPKQIKVVNDASLNKDSLEGELFARSGCCSYHGGVCGCDQSSDRIICCDGSLSPTCTCSNY